MDNKIENTVLDKQEQYLKPELTTEHYKKIATQKYLIGEIDIDTLHSILSTLEDKEKKRKPPNDPSYVWKLFYWILGKIIFHKNYLRKTSFL